MNDRVEDFFVLLTPLIVLLFDILRKTLYSHVHSMILYLSLIFYGIIILNVQFTYMRYSGRGIKPIWIVPVMIAVQYYISLIVDYEVASFIALTVLLLVFARYVGSNSLSSINWSLYVSFSVIIVFIAMYLGIPYLPYVLLGPVWEYLFIQSICGDKLGDCIPPASLSASIIYNYDYFLMIYTVIASNLKQLFKYKLSYMLILDGIIRVLLLWVLHNAA